jgi:DNA-binding IclR family transcriptional regulator
MPSTPARPRGRRPSTGAVADAPSADERYRAPALDKGLDILELLAAQPQGLTRAEIVKEMDRSASEIYRMLERLVARQYVMRNPSNSPRGWSFSVQRGARVGLLDTASGHLLLAYADAASYQRMRAEHTPLDGEVPITETQLAGVLATIRKQGYVQRDSAQSFGVVDISFPILGPDNTALATLTCPYIRRIDRHVDPDMSTVRAYLQDAAAALSLTQGMLSPES